MLVVLSLDSVAAPLIDQLIAEGRLENLAELRKRGRTVELAEELPGAAYATLYTGRRLADHGVHFPLQWSASDQTSRPYDDLMSAELERHSLFKRLAKGGVRVLVLDPPECAPHSFDRGVIASGLQFRARILLREWSRPADALPWVAARAGRSPEVNEIFGQPTPRYLLNMRRDLMAAPDRLACAWEHLAGRGGFDFIWVNFVAAHQAGHVLFDPWLGEGFSGPDAKALRGALVEVYLRVDAALGRILSMLPSECDVLLLSPKGMGANTARVDLLSGMLDRILGQGRGAAGPPQTSPLWRLRSCAPVPLRAWIASALPDRVAVALAGRLETLGRDWSRTRAFALPCDNHGFVRFNLQGRERRGSVPQSKASELSLEIVDGLLSFEDLEGVNAGGPSVARVEPRWERAETGAGVEGLPDVFVHWTQTPSARIRGVRSPRFGEVLRDGVGTGRSGNHCRGAWLTLAPGRARMASTIPELARLEDVAPTICSALGLPHADLPGQALLVRA